MKAIENLIQRIGYKAKDQTLLVTVGPGFILAIVFGILVAALLLNN